MDTAAQTSTAIAVATPTITGPATKTADTNKSERQQIRCRGMLLMRKMLNFAACCLHVMMKYHA